MLQTKRSRRRENNQELAQKARKQISYTQIYIFVFGKVFFFVVLSYRERKYVLSSIFVSMSPLFLAVFVMFQSMLTDDNNVRYFLPQLLFATAGTHFI